MDTKCNKVFIISLDGATFSVINPLVQQGYMPALGTLMSQSVCTELESVLPPVTAPAWTSFMTGKHPNKHGIFDFARFNPERYSWTINNASHIQSKTVWQILSDKGKRVVVLNLPYTYPPYEVNGVLLAGWDAPLTDAPFSHPPEVSSQIVSRFADYKKNLWVSELQPLCSDIQFNQFTHKLKTGFEQQATIAMDLLAREKWDVFMVHFQQTDWIQHKLWSYIEQSCNDPRDHSPKIEATRECYRQFDNLVGQLLRQVEPHRPITILLSDHGFGRLMGNINANYYLREWGYFFLLAQAEERLDSVKKFFRESNYKAVRDFYQTIARTKNRLDGDGAQHHESWVDNAHTVMRSRAATWDWSRTKAALVYAYQMGFVYVNLVGRGPLGIVQSGSEYESIINDLITRFKEIRHPRTGEHLLSQVVPGMNIYPAAETGVAVPDLVLIPREGYNFSFAVTDAVPKASEEGTHRHNGVFIIKGDAISDPGPNFQPDLIDITPTILHCLDLPIPTDLDGRVLRELLVSDDRHIRYEEVDNSHASPSVGGYTQQEEDIVAERLTGLGYLN